MSTKSQSAPIARNSPCPCGSGKKYKLCCLRTIAKQQDGRPPDDVDSREKLSHGLELLRAGQRERAVELFREVITCEPQNVDALNLLGSTLAQAGEHERALPYLLTAVLLENTTPTCFQNLSAALCAMGDFAAAIGCLRAAAQRWPQDASLWRLLGNVEMHGGSLTAAITAYQKTLELQPSDGSAHGALGLAFDALGDYAAAVHCYQTAHQLSPADATACTYLGMDLMRLGRLEEARATYAEALRLDPTSAHNQINLAHVMQWTGSWDGLERLWTSTRLAVRERPNGTVNPFLFLAVPATASELLTCTRSWARTFEVPSIARPEAGRSGAATRRERLRIGYLSADFREHAVGHLIAGVFEQHDRDRVEVIAYSIGPNDQGPLRVRVISAADQFVDLAGLGYRAAADRIAADNVDILLDLNGFTAFNRTHILAQRPGAIQVNFLGYPGTMGAAFIDYILVDRFVVPPDQAEHFSERLAYMPDCYQPNDRHKQISEIESSRHDFGLPDHGFVFAGFNQSYKITPEVFSLWMRLLAAVPESVLWLFEGNAFASANLRQEASAAGIEPSRIVFARYMPIAQHLARHRLADLFLDTLPYNGHTTTSDALWSGVPVLTCAGETFASRVAGSLLQAVGLPEMITYSLDEYEALALVLARNPARLAGLRRRLAANRLAAPLFDTARYTRNLEGLYARMWEEYCRSGSPAGDSRTPVCL